MQLPPTILSVDKPGKSSGDPSATKPTKNQKSGKPASKAPAPPKENKEATPPPETSISSDSSADEAELSDEGVKEEIVTPVRHESKTRSKSTKQRSLRPPRSLETTMFDRLEKMYGPGIKRMLNVQYRYVPFE